MKKYFICCWHLIIFLLFVSISYAQLSNGIYVPVDLRPVYENGTRLPDGRPGPNYWQNKSDYTMQVELIPKDRKIMGKSEITYNNNSPDTLKQMVFRLYPNIFKKGQIRDLNLNPDDINNGMTISRLQIDDQSLDQATIDSLGLCKITNLEVDLDTYIIPETQSHIEFEWSCTTSFKKNIRAGAYDSTSFMIAYWYPQIAVYDDVDGWDRFNYTGVQEFYNDFNNYVVNITVPKGFLVWATGELMNADEVLASSVYKKYKKALKTDEIVSIVDNEDIQSGQITQTKGKLTWKFTAQGVPDFVFATSNHYLWDQTSLQVGPDKRRVKIGAAYNKNSEDFYKVDEIARNAINYFSTQLPGVAYPFPSMTVFNGSGGMEFPMMVNDGSTEKMSSTISLTSHEIAHSYFPFYMGINERKYAWMDEGWAVMLPFDFVLKESPDLDRKAVVTTEYSYLAGKEYDLPTMIPSVAYGGQLFRPSYRGASYTKTAMAYQALRDLLGDDLFKKALHTYMDRWHGKHPIPYDFFFTFNDVVGEDLSWFWNPWFFEPGYPDLAIGEIKINKNIMLVSIDCLGNVPVPVCLTIIYSDNTEKQIDKKADIWKNGERSLKLEIKTDKLVKRLELGNKYIPDIDLKNNTHILNK